MTKYRKLSLKEIFGTGPFFTGDPTFHGGHFGFGGERQLIKLDPEVKKVRDQEQEEANKNIEDLNWSLGKYNTIYNDMQIVDSDKKSQNNDDLDEATENLQERNVADINYTHLPGHPRPNAIEYPKLNVPGAGRPDGTEEYMLDDEFDRNEEEELGHENETRTNNMPHGGMGVLVSPKNFFPTYDDNNRKNFGYAPQMKFEKFEKNKKNDYHFVSNKIKKVKKELKDLIKLLINLENPKNNKKIKNIKNEIERLEYSLYNSFNENNFISFDVVKKEIMEEIKFRNKND